MPGDKHLIQCHCILPQYKKMPNPIFHKFVVFSEIDADGDVIPKLVKCNNCGVIHKVTDFCRSEFIHGVEDTISIIGIGDLRPNVPDSVSEILDNHKCDVATWEQVNDVIKNLEWGSRIVISKEKLFDSTQIKQIVIENIDSVRVESHLRKDEISRTLK